MPCRPLAAPPALPLLAALLLAACSPAVGPPDAGPVDAGPVDAGPEPTGWWRGKVFYEIFVRSFADSDGDGVGDLRGLISRLDALATPDGGTGPSLGVDALWLMPIYPSASYHGYDVLDYQAVNPAYGTLADLDALLQAAHARGLKVILDFVPNHTSNEHPWFQDARSGGPHRDWYVWQPSAPATSRWSPLNGSWYYAYFWSGMPDLNFRTPAVEQALGDAMLFWLQRGVDGFRVDGARYLVESANFSANGISEQPETHLVLQRLHARLAATYPDALLVGEVWADQATVATYWGGAQEFQLAFSFDLADSLVTSLRVHSRSAVLNAIARTELALQGQDRGYEAPFLTNHDQVRVMRQLGGDAAAARLGAAMLMALPGTPFVYYGEELGMRGGPSGADEDKRTPMRWQATGPLLGFSSASTSWYGPLATEAGGVEVATQQADPDSLWNLYRRLIALRHAQPALAGRDATRATITVVSPADSDQPYQPLALLRSRGTSRILFVGNFGTTALGALTLSLGGTPTVLEAEGLVGTPHATGGTLTLDGLGPRGFAFLSLD